MTKLEIIKCKLEKEILDEDGGPVVTSDDIQWLIDEIEKYRKALNYIGILQMGELDYTKDFFEQTKIIVREVLK